MNLKINKKILILVLVIVLFTGALFIFLSQTGDNSNKEQVEDTSSVDLTAIFNDGEYEKTQDIADERLKDEELSNEKRAEAFYQGMNARIAFDNPEFAYDYVKENEKYIAELELPFDFYVLVGNLAAEFNDNELAKQVYKKALEFNFERGEVEELYLQKEIKEKLNALE